jgi:hypothetical protein
MDLSGWTKNWYPLGANEGFKTLKKNQELN